MWFEKKEGRILLGPDLEVKGIQVHVHKQGVRSCILRQEGDDLVATCEEVQVRFVRSDASLEVTAGSARVRHVEVLLEGEGFRKVFAHGFQTWNQSHMFELGRDSRRKSLVSRFGPIRMLGLTAMFQDTDGPVWKRKGKGVESHGYVVLQKNSDMVILGCSSCRKATTSFWVSQHEEKVYVSWYLSFGNPGLGVGATAGEKIFLDRISGDENSCQVLTEAFMLRMKENQDQFRSPELELRSPLRDLGHAPVGWGSWYEFYEKVTANDVDNVLKAISGDEQVRKSIDVFQLDDGYQLSVGDWLQTQDPFGAKKLEDVAINIKNSGFTPGLWTAPFLVSKTSSIAKTHPEWLLCRVDRPSRPIVGHFNPAWYRGALSSMIMYVLDLSNPEVLNHITETFRDLAKHWKFFKIDFLVAGMREGIRMDDNQTRVEAYIAGLKAIRRGIGPDSYLLGCGAPLMASGQSGVFDAMRITCDTAERWLPPAIINFFVSDWAVPSCRNVLWGCLTRYNMHGTLWKHNDPDCLVLRRKGNSMTEEEIVTQVTVLGLTGGLLLFTDDMSKLPRDRLQLALRILPASPIPARSFGDMLLEKIGPDVFAINDPNDLTLTSVAAYLNWTRQKRSQPIHRKAFDFWRERVVNKNEMFNAVANAVRAFQFAREGAICIGTTIHLTALADGRIECEDDGNSCTIRSSYEFAMTTGIFIFDAKPENLSISLSEGIQVVEGLYALPDSLDHTCALKVSINQPAWSLVLTRI